MRRRSTFSRFAWLHAHFRTLDLSPALPGNPLDSSAVVEQVWSRILARPPAFDSGPAEVSKHRGAAMPTLGPSSKMKNMIQALKARVSGGRLVLDEPTDLPNGTEVELVLLDEVLASGGDYLDDEERARLHQSIDRGFDDIRGGRTLDARQVMAGLRTRAVGG